MKKKIFMLKKLYRDVVQAFSRKPIYEISSSLNSSVLEYPFIFKEAEIASGKKQRLISSFDSNGIPLIKSYIDINDDDLHYYPITIGQVGISVYQTYLETRSDQDKNRFMKYVDWFVKNKISDTLGTYWLTHVPKPEYNVFQPWKSAFVQSRAISILLRAYHITKNKEYLDTIDSALDIYLLSYDKNGVTVFTEKGNAIYEEYVAEKPTRVLDGHIFSLFGLIDILNYSKLLPNSLLRKAQSIFDSGIKGLVEILAKYDMGNWVKFCLAETEGSPLIEPCTVSYLKLIIIQLELLYTITKITEFNIYQKKFSSYLTVKNIIKSYTIKYKALKKLNRL